MFDSITTEGYLIRNKKDFILFLKKYPNLVQMNTVTPIDMSFIKGVFKYKKRSLVNKLFNKVDPCVIYVVEGKYGIVSDEKYLSTQLYRRVGKEWVIM